MLVVEDRNDAVVLPKRICDLAKEPPARVEMLPFFVPGIVPVLADAQHAIDRNGVGSDGNGLFDGLEEGHAVFGRHGPSEILVGKLIDVHGGQPELRPRPAILFPALENLADDHVRMRVGAILGDDGGDRFGAARGSTPGT